jgi:hypothetical protein
VPVCFCGADGRHPLPNQQSRRVLFRAKCQLHEIPLDAAWVGFMGGTVGPQAPPGRQEQVVQDRPTLRPSGNGSSSGAAGAPDRLEQLDNQALQCCGTAEAYRLPDRCNWASWTRRPPRPYRSRRCSRPSGSCWRTRTPRATRRDGPTGPTGGLGATIVRMNNDGLMFALGTSCR